MDFSLKKLWIALILTVLVGWIVFPYLYAILAAGILSILIHPAYQKLANIIGARKSSLMITLLIVICVLVPILLAIGYSIAEIIDYAQGKSSIKEFLLPLEKALENLPYIGNKLTYFFHHFSEYFKDNQNNVASYLEDAFPTLKNFTAYSAHFIVSIIIIVLLMYQFLVSSKSIHRFFNSIILNDFEDRDFFISTIIKTTRVISLSMIITGFFAGVVMSIVYVCLSIPGGIYLGIITGLVALIPFVLPLFYLILSLVIFAIYGYVSALVLLGFGIFVNLFTDNILQPKIVNKHTEISFVTSFIGIICGLETIGILGIFIGPVVFNLAITFIKKTLQRQKQEKELSK